MKFDLIICGGGVIGCASLYHLLDSGLSNSSILLIERCSSIAHCASGNAGGFLARNWCDGEGALEHLAKSSFDAHVKFASKVGPETIGFRMMSALSVEVTKQNEQSSSSSSSAWLKGKGVQNIEYLAKEESSSTAQVHPRLLCEALLNQSQILAKKQNLNLKIMTSTSVSKLFFETENRDEVTSVGIIATETQEKSKIEVGGLGVLLCLGPWTAHIERMLFAESEQPQPKCSPYLIELSRSFKPHKVQSISIKSDIANSKNNNQAVFTSPSSDAGFGSIEPEIYPRPDGTTYLCGISDNEPLPEDPMSVCGNAEKAKILRRFADHVIIGESVSTPEQKDYSSAACYLPTPSDNRRPLIGAMPACKNLYSSCGHTCWGILNCMGSGLVIAEIVREKCPALFVNSEYELQQQQQRRELRATTRTIEPKNLLKYVTTQIEEEKWRGGGAPTKRKNENW